MAKPSSLPKHARDNRANQLNPNNAAYWRSRGRSGPSSSDSSTSEFSSTRSLAGSISSSSKKSD